MVKQPIGEMRQALRAKRILSIQFRIVKTRIRKADKRWHLSTTHDMSFLGLAFFSDIPLHVDDIIEMNVVMSGILDIFKGYGQVVRVEKKAAGVFFLIAIKFVDYKRALRNKPSRTAGAAVSSSRRTHSRK
ncbi:MAG TPA: PilZ domain-containing protein [Candidatus Omnitrophota bacterium]|nr:PilZ domain-containing protein [Candidatus Omnitrophota bacterium]HPB69072.1 PilZ domain-containing protein [Candidatus Omnitrophota bacterium]HQO58666.1 PilZ domain-containing protein [Candidatus Omnitrophota bacterium]HQP11160.1 PilZ domain-containing protein [Candidatus Omnitrophota bacterium]